LLAARGCAKVQAVSRRPIQQLIPFGAAPETPRADALRYRPSAETFSAVERLESWLLAPRGRMTELAEEALFCVRKALIEGKGSYHHQAGDLLEALKLRNGRTEGNDIPAGRRVLAGEDF
jgi:hypothetical protein